MTVIIGIDPHKASHTAVAIDQDERPLAELRIAAATGQARRRAVDGGRRAPSWRSAPGRGRRSPGRDSAARSSLR